MRPLPKFSLMFFASDENSLVGDKYAFVLEAAKFADQRGFSALWVPERHYTRLGCLFPNPSLLLAAVAAQTTRLRLSASSVVLPLHDPIQVAEDWAMLDNLSHGRAAPAFASGWNPGDFVTRPESYVPRHERLFEHIETIRHLWRGGRVQRADGQGLPTEIAIYPTPVQAELPIWVTAAGNPLTYERAGASGANLLTHVLDHGVEKLGGLIAIYRQARERHGFDPDTGIVSVMLHTFIGDTHDQVRSLVREPFCNYLKANIGLLEGLAKSRGQTINVAALSEADLDAFVGMLFDRFHHSRALIGTPESCLELVRNLSEVGVDECACLLDFGPAPDLILRHLPALDALRRLCAPEPESPPAAEEPPIEAIQAQCPEQWSGSRFYTLLAERGLALSGAFGGIEKIWRRDGEALARIRTPDHSADNGYLLHPAFLDSMFQAVAMAVPQQRFADESLYLPAGLGALTTDDSSAMAVWSHAKIVREDEHSVTADVALRDESGAVVGRARELRLEAVLTQKTAERDIESIYGVEWLAKPVTSSSPRGRWLILQGDDDLAEPLMAKLRSSGAICELASAASAGTWLDVVHLGTWRQLAENIGQIPSGARLWIVTKGAQYVAGSLTDPEAAMLWGIGRTWSAEYPERWGGLIDLDPAASTEQSAAELAVALQADDGEDQVAFRNGVRHVARLARTPMRSGAKLRLRPDAAYLVTGGRQGFGLAAARRLAERGARHLILLGRKAPPQRFPELERLGVNVTYASVDVGDAAAISEFLRAWQVPKIGGVIHAASQWRSETGEAYVRSLDGLTVAEYEQVISAKSRGAALLESALEGLPLDFMVYFSSAASLVGSAGQGNYAAASAHLDALAQARHARGLPTLSIDWGPISQTGFGDTPEGRRLHEIWDRQGIRRIAPEEALDVMETLLAANVAQAAVMQVDWAGVKHNFPALAGAPYFERLMEGAARKEPEFVTRLRAQTGSAAQELMLLHVQDELMSVMNYQPGDSLDVDRGLFDAGMDSLMALELKSRLQASLGLDIPATIAFEYPNARAIAAHLYERVAAAAPSSSWVNSAETVTSDDLLSRISRLSDEEASHLLNARGNSN